MLSWERAEPWSRRKSGRKTRFRLASPQIQKIFLNYKRPVLALFTRYGDEVPLLPFSQSQGRPRTPGTRAEREPRTVPGEVAVGADSTVAIGATGLCLNAAEKGGSTVSFLCVIMRCRSGGKKQGWGGERFLFWERNKHRAPKRDPRGVHGGVLSS